MTMICFHPNHNKYFSTSILPTDLAYFYFRQPFDQKCLKPFCPVIVRLNRIFRSAYEWNFGQNQTLNINFSTCPTIRWLCKFSSPRADRMKEFFDRTETRTNSPNAFRILQVGEFSQKCSLNHLSRWSSSSWSSSTGTPASSSRSASSSGSARTSGSTTTQWPTRTTRWRRSTSTGSVEASSTILRKLSFRINLV